MAPHGTARQQPARHMAPHGMAAVGGRWGEGGEGSSGDQADGISTTGSDQWQQPSVPPLPTPTPSPAIVPDQPYKHADRCHRSAHNAPSKWPPTTSESFAIFPEAAQAPDRWNIRGRYAAYARGGNPAGYSYARSATHPLVRVKFDCKFQSTVNIGHT